jgi:UDP-N-acetylmuramoylalanine--D-glutamate ligase
LVDQGALVTVTDQADEAALVESIRAIRDLPVTLHLGGHEDGDLDSCDVVIVNPAVDKRKSAFFQAMVQRSISWTTEMNLFCQRCPATVIGVTGTFGKSTTCAMLAAAFEFAAAQGVSPYRAVHLGGNIGRSLLGDLDAMDERDLVVLEMSNAQLEDLPRIAWAPHVAVITNLFPHHLDRYIAFADYAQAKLNIIRHPKRTGPVVVGPMHAEAEAMLVQALAEWTDPQSAAGGRRVAVELPAEPFRLRVPGAHNQANAACVLTTCCLPRTSMTAAGLGPRERAAEATAASSTAMPDPDGHVDADLVRRALAEFRGLPHRLEFVRTLDGVDYYNDSKSTAPPATIVALKAIDRPTVAIVGGQQKNVPLGECAGTLAHRCRAVVCMGESGPAFRKALSSAVLPIPTQVVPGLIQAVPTARSLAQAGDVVLLSPGAPSFDQYGNFTERGRHFIDLVADLKGCVS